MTKYPMNMTKSEFAKHAKKIVEILQSNIEKKELEIQVKNILIHKLVNIIEKNNIELPDDVQSVISKLFVKQMIADKDSTNEESKENKKENDDKERNDTEERKAVDPEAEEGKSEFEKAKERKEKQSSGFSRVEE